MKNFMINERTEMDADEAIREEIRSMVRTLEIFYEELEKSKLPEDIKKAMLMNAKFNQ